MKGELNSFRAIENRISPRVGYDDPCFNAGVLFKEVQQVAAFEQLQRLAIRKVERGFAVTARRDQYSLRSAFVLQCPEKIAYGADADGVLVPLRLDDDLATKNRSVVVRNAIHAAVA